MQKHVNLVDLVKTFPTNIYLQTLASIQKRTSPVKFARLAEKSGKGSISNLSIKVGVGHARAEHRAAEVREGVRLACPGWRSNRVLTALSQNSRRPAVKG